MQKQVYFILLTFLLALPASAMRCGTQLVSEGDSQYSVLSKCGEPLDKRIYEETVPIFDAWGYQIGTTTNTVETWIYQKSSADFQYELIFESGKIKQINVNRNP